jgi:hypothetical protein
MASCQLWGGRVERTGQADAGHVLFGHASGRDDVLNTLSGVKPETRNPKPKTQNLKPATRDPRPETRNPEPESRNPRPETRNPKAEIRNLEPEIPNPRIETRNAKPEMRNPQAAGRIPARGKHLSGKTFSHRKSGEVRPHLACFQRQNPRIVLGTVTCNSARAEDAQRTPTQCHISPSIF